MSVLASLPSPNLPISNDSEVQLTADDALISKLSCAVMGYFNDPYLYHFVKNPIKRSPLINRGYYSRVASVSSLLNDFLEINNVNNNNLEEVEQKPKCQIVSLGCGYDTAYFRLKSDKKYKNYSFFEIDYPEVCKKKRDIVIKQKPMLDIIYPNNKPNTYHDFGKSNIFLKGNDYTLLSSDIRIIDTLHQDLLDAGLDFELPTFFISECVMIYLYPKDSDGIINWIKSAFKTAGFMTYEQIRPDDAFGKVMIAHLEARGCPLLGLRGHPSLETQIERFQGWTLSRALDMNDVYHLYLNADDVKRIEKIEMWDEYEEWNMIQAHYCIVVATIGESLNNLRYVSFNVEESREKYRESTRINFPSNISFKK